MESDTPRTVQALPTRVVQPRRSLPVSRWVSRSRSYDPRFASSTTRGSDQFTHGCPQPLRRRTPPPDPFAQLREYPAAIHRSCPQATRFHVKPRRRIPSVPHNKRRSDGCGTVPGEKGGTVSRRYRLWTTSRENLSWRHSPMVISTTRGRYGYPSGCCGGGFPQVMNRLGTTRRGARSTDDGTRSDSGPGLR